MIRTLIERSIIFLLMPFPNINTAVTAINEVLLNVQIISVYKTKIEFCKKFLFP